MYKKTANRNNIIHFNYSLCGCSIRIPIYISNIANKCQTSIFKGGGDFMLIIISKYTLYGQSETKLCRTMFSIPIIYKRVFLRFFRNFPIFYGFSYLRFLLMWLLRQLYCSHQVQV